MLKPIFEYNLYKDYVNAALKFREGGGRGERSRLAKALGCHSGYISQVLGGNADFSLEQGEKINHFLGHTPDESAFFLTLIQKDRAGTPTLRKYFQEQVDELSKKRFVLKDRLKVRKTLSQEDQTTFYSSWHYGAVHVLVSLPLCNTDQKISEYLGISLQKTREIVQFLLEVGLIARRDDGYKIGETHIHLGQDSPMISKHHTNWRLQAIRSLDSAGTEHLHYSSVITASHGDSGQIREILVRAIEQIRKVVRDSKEEEAYSYLVDFFPLKEVR